ncbi:glycosyl hydrolase family 95 catalytic domain-containing protein [Pedobacter sp. AW31-3R]|uniref:glycosyl hydrolase family 95 catalytic domain-containing protein n=1 Tax=Pedobacter sp. AW31-3R TaxID=3445781 RepID=UPI003F9F8FA0
MRNSKLFFRMVKILIYSLCSVLCLQLLNINAVKSQQTTFSRPAHGFTSWHPAETWEHSLLSGNGTMGAMVIGQPYDETLLLSHSQLFMPQKRSGKRFEQESELTRIRKTLMEGKYPEAAAIPARLRKDQGYDDIRDPFIPAFDLKISQTAGDIRAYQRALNFETGEAIVNWTDQQGSFERKVFVSRADSVIVLSIKGDNKINSVLRFSQRPVEWLQSKFVKDGMKEMHAAAEAEGLTFSAAFNHVYEGGLTGYAGLARLYQKGGTHQVDQGSLVITDADEVLLLIKIKASYSTADPVLTSLGKDLNLLHPASYDELLRRHVRIHGELFNRVKLDLRAKEEERRMNNESLIQLGNKKVSLALIERVFDAGRYNIISSTGVLPPNLQGLWSGTWTTPWSGGFTLDGNLPTAISILMPGNTPELMKGFFSFHENLMADYRQEARQLFGARGIHIPAQVTTRGVETDFGETWCLTYWTGAAGWTANYFNDYYLYTGDRKFLAEHAYPFMKEAALFYEDFLKTGENGKLLFIPSYSPENNPKGINSQATINATMDVMIASQLLRNCIAAAKVLKVDQLKIRQWEQMLKKMPAYEVNADGALKEWIWPGLEDNYGHRHASQLYALYDGLEPEFKNDQVLRKAAGVLLDKKMAFRQAEGGGEMAFGLVQLGTAAAHLGDAVKAAELTNWLASTYWSKGMGSFHNVKEMFNTDISGGLPYLITQLLCFSAGESIYVLPALPAEWHEGTISGLLLRGQITVNKLKWDDKSVELELISPVPQKVELHCGNSILKAVLKANEPKKLTLSR